MPRTRAELLMKVQKLESTIWDGTRQLADLEAENERLREALQQARDCCARPAGVCFPTALIDGGESA